MDATPLAHTPFPIAQLCVRTQNAKSPLDFSLCAYYAWEATIKLVSYVSVAEYSARYASADEVPNELYQRLRRLTCPTTGDWLEFIRLIVPLLSSNGDHGFQSLEAKLCAVVHDDLPRCCELEAHLHQILDGNGQVQPRVHPLRLLDLLVRYRNSEVGHGAVGQLTEDHYRKTGQLMHDALLELLHYIDVVAGREIRFIKDVSREPSGDWRIDALDFSGPIVDAVPPERFPASNHQALPKPKQLYLACESTRVPLHPLLWYEHDDRDVKFMNARRGENRIEYLSYVTGRVESARLIDIDQLDLLSRALNANVEQESVIAWASELEEASAGSSTEVAGGPRSHTRVGEFEIVSKVGIGGMGDVYRARQPSLGRQVAVKCMRRVGDPESEMRFTREIRVLGRVEHPNLVKVFSSGQDGDRWYYAMEFIEGATLSGIFGQLHLSSMSASTVGLRELQHAIDTAYLGAKDKEGHLSIAEGLCQNGSELDVSSEPQPRLTFDHRQNEGGSTYLDSVVELMRQVCSATSALHDAGIVHRDIKPENIIVSPNGQRAVLMDLGLAKILNDDNEITRTRQFVGTLRFASPEQIRSSKHLDYGTDVYSIGVILWELFALRPIYEIEEGVPIPDAMQRIQYHEAGTLRNADIPSDLQAVVFKCLEKVPGRRYRNANELHDELTRWQEGKPVQAKPRSLPRTVSGFARRNRLSASLLAAAGLIALVVFVVYKSAQSSDVDEFNITPAELRKIHRLVEDVLSVEPRIAAEPHPSRTLVPVVSEPDWSSFRTLETIRICDLREWQELSQDQLSEKNSPVVVTLRERIRKIAPSNEIQQRAFTSGLELFIRCERNPDVRYDPGPFKVVYSESQKMRGGLSMRPAMAKLDISDVPVGETFGVDWVQTYWNAYQRNDQRFTGMEIRQNVDEAKILAIAPEGSMMSKVRLQVAREGDKPPEVYQGPKVLYIAPDKSYVYWQILEPKAGQYYRLAFQLEPRGM